MKIQAIYSKPSQNSMTPSSVGAHPMTVISTGMPFCHTYTVKMIFFFFVSFMAAAVVKGRSQKVPVLVFLTAGPQYYSSHSYHLNPLFLKGRKLPWASFY